MVVVQGGAAFSAAILALDEKVKQDQQRSEKCENQTAGHSAARDPRKRAGETCRHGLETRIRAWTVKRANHCISRKGTADSASLVLDPNRNFLTGAPDKHGAKRKE
jgi:hypothetical protein